MNVRIVAVLLGCLALGGCQEKREFTLNPDGSGKVVYESVAVKPMDAFERLSWAHGIVSGGGAGVEAWAAAGMEDRDGKAVFRGTALFADVNRVNVGNSQLRPVWTVKADGSAVLQLGRPDKPAPAGKPAPLTEGQVAEKIKAKREAPLVPPGTEESFRRMRQEYVFHVPGEVVERTNFSVDKGGALSLTLTGEGFMKASEAVKASDADMRAIVLAGEGNAVGDAKLCRELFGKEAGVSARVKVGSRPAFDYPTAVAAARGNYLAMMTKLGLHWTDIPKTMPLRFKSMVQSAAARDSVRFKTQLPRPAVECRGGLIFRMTAADGTLLLPCPGRSQTVERSTDNILVRVPAGLPAGARTLKEVLGAMAYTAATVKKVDLGFDDISVGARGKAYDARIVSISTKRVAGKERTEIVIGLRVPDGVQRRDVNMSFPFSHTPAPTRHLDRGPSPLPDGLQGTSFRFDGPLDWRPRFTATVWENVEQFVVPFRLTDVPLTPEGLEAAQGAQTPAARPEVRRAGQPPRNATKEPAAVGVAYRKAGQYEDLKWLADHFLKAGLPRTAVEKVLGEGDEPPMGSPRTRQYAGTREEPWGHLLLIHYKGAAVESWEWADE